MMPDVQKIAALSMLEMTEEQKIRLRADMEEILSIGESMPLADGETSASRSVSLDALRADDADLWADAPGLLALSQKARDGYIVVSRTVGGTA